MAEAIEDLRKIFESMGETRDENPVVWLKCVRDKLYTMFKAPLKDQYRQEAFKWVASLCMSIEDFSWLTSEDKWSPEEAKIFSLITRLSMNEILILMPHIQHHLTSNDDEEREDGKVVARSANKSEYDAFGDHLVIMESTIKSLIKNQEEHEETGGGNDLTECINSNELQNLLERLKETISEICDYLEVCHRYWTKLDRKSSEDKLSAFQGAMRIMSLWLSEDTGSFEPQCKRFLIDLIIKNLLLVERPTDRDIHMTALHSICTQADELATTLKQHPDHEKVLQKYLDHVQKERDEGKSDSRRAEKKYKLRCGLVRDLMSVMQKQ